MKPSRQFFLFSAVGVVGLIVDLCVLYALAPLSDWYMARAVSFWSAATTTWLFNRKFTFLSRKKPVPTRWNVLCEYFHYLAAMLGGGSLNYLTYVLTLQYWLSPFAAAVGVILGSIAGLMLNFWLSRWFVFAKKTDSSDSANSF